MTISIAQRCRPFDTQLGTLLPLPHSLLAVRVWPALLQFVDISVNPFRSVSELKLSLPGPLASFTTQLDLEGGQLLIWGGVKDSYLRYSLQATPSGVSMTLLRGVSPLHLSSDTLSLSHDHLLPKQSVHIDIDVSSQITCQDQDLLCLSRLSMGCHKAQRWSHMQQRSNYCELMPHLYRLSQQLPNTSAISEPKETLLMELRQAINDGDSAAATHLLGQMLCYGMAADSLLLPDLKHGQACGLSKPLAHSSSEFIHGVSDAFLTMLIHAEPSNIALLPLPPTSHHCGRITNLPLYDKKLSLDFEWSKKLPRRLCLRTQHSFELSLAGSRHVRSYRLQRKGSSTKHRHNIDDVLHLEADQEYLVDNFEK